MDEKIKYVLNGVTKYYTREELKEYIIELFRKNGTESNDEFWEDYIDSEIKLLKKYDGDPYGWVQGEEDRKASHELEAMGWLIEFR